MARCALLVSFIRAYALASQFEWVHIQYLLFLAYFHMEERCRREVVAESKLKTARLEGKLYLIALMQYALTIFKAYILPSIRTFQTCACTPDPKYWMKSMFKGLSLPRNSANLGPGTGGRDPIMSNDGVVTSKERKYNKFLYFYSLKT